MENELGKSAELKRDEIVAKVLAANTWEQRKDAELSLLAWMKNHPRDFGMLDAGEQLAMMSGRYDHTAEETALSGKATRMGMENK